jgi:hypothetical protein
MSLQDIVTVTISLQTAAVSRAGFGTPIFIGEHRWFTERVRSYPNITAASADLPAGSNELIAVNSAFSQEIPPSVVKVGRRDVTLLTYTPDAVTAIGEVFEITVVGTDNVTIAASFTTATGSETPTEVVTALSTALSGIVGVTVSGTATLTLAEATPGTPFAVTKITKLTQTTTATETAAAVITAITEIDNDFYFITSNDQTQVFILAMAAVTEALTKIYFVSVKEEAALTALEIPAASGDTLGKLAESNFFRTSGWFHQDADTKFPEMAFVAIAAPSTPGSKVWANNRIAGLAASRDATGKNLTFTQKNNLDTRNANWIESVGGIDITRRGKVAGDEWIDAIRNRDFLEARITEGLQNLQINQPVIPYTDSGIGTVRNTVTSVLSRSVSTSTTPSILQESNPYTTNFPRAADVPFAEKQLRELNASFVAFLAGAIQITKITGVLTFDNLA